MLDTILLQIFIPKYAHENVIIIPCPDSAGDRKDAKGLLKAAYGQFWGVILNPHLFP